MSVNDQIAIIAMARTPMGDFQGQFRDLTASQLGGFAIAGAVARSGLAPAQFDEAYMGCVLSAGQGQAPARQAVRHAGLPPPIGATTINKMCGSGMKSIMLAHDLLAARSARCLIAGGMESMSRAPYLVARGGYRLGHGQMQDHMFVDGLEDAYARERLMGHYAEDCAKACGFSRTDQDDFAMASLNRAKKAQTDGAFAAEITPVTTPSGLYDQDEHPLNANIAKIPLLKPVFDANGTVTAANSSAISDGAAALVLMRSAQARAHHAPILGHIIAHTTHAHEWDAFATAPIGALRKLAHKTGWALQDVDLFEINEAFATVTMATMRELDLPHHKVNIHGGACALGHPIGASGARIVITLLSALHRHRLKRGMAAICLGGGEALAMAIEAEF